mgnify:CR=1 FL=1
MEATTDQKNLELAQQGGIVITAVATLAIASIKIYKILKANPIEATES